MKLYAGTGAGCHSLDAGTCLSFEVVVGCIVVAQKLTSVDLQLGVVRIYQ